MRWYLAEDLSEQEQIAFQSLDTIMQLSGEVLDDDKSNLLKKVKVEDKYYYFKKYYTPGNHLRKWLGFSRAYREWRNFGWLAGWAVPVPRRVVFGEGARWQGEYWGVFVSEEVTGSLNLDEAWQHKIAVFSVRKDRLKLIDALAEAIGKLHKKQFIHNDLHWRNIIVGPNAGDVCIIDCPSGRPVYLRGNRRGLVKDLANMDKSAKLRMSRTDRLRFYLRYCAVLEGIDKVGKLNGRQKTEIFRILNFFAGRK